MPAFIDPVPMRRSEGSDPVPADALRIDPRKESSMRYSLNGVAVALCGVCGVESVTAGDRPKSAHDQMVMVYPIGDLPVYALAVDGEPEARFDPSLFHSEPTPLHVELARAVEPAQGLTLRGPGYFPFTR
jgi:hypothetical protein